MIFNLTGKHTTADQHKRKVEDLSVRDRAMLRTLLYKDFAAIDDVEKQSIVEEIIILANNGHQDVCDTCPELIMGKPKCVLLNPSNAFYELIAKAMKKEDWVVLTSVK